MEPQNPNTSLRKVRTFADDVRRARGEVIEAAPVINRATSAVAPTVLARSDVPIVLPKLAMPSHVNIEGDQINIGTAANGMEEGTIVSEHKAARWSFTDSVANAFSNCFMF